MKSAFLQEMELKLGEMMEEVMESIDDTNDSPTSTDLNSTSALLSPSILSVDKR